MIEEDIEMNQITMDQTKCGECQCSFDYKKVRCTKDCFNNCLSIKTCCEILGETDLTEEEKEAFPLSDIDIHRNKFLNKTNNVCYIVLTVVASYIVYGLAVMNITEAIALKSNFTN